MCEYMKVLKNLGFKKTDNTWVRLRGKFGKEIIDLDALTWYYPFTAKNAEGHWQYYDLTEMLHDIKMHYGPCLVKTYCKKTNLLEN